MKKLLLSLLTTLVLSLSTMHAIVPVPDATPAKGAAAGAKITADGLVKKLKTITELPDDATPDQVQKAAKKLPDAVASTIIAVGNVNPNTYDKVRDLMQQRTPEDMRPMWKKGLEGTYSGIKSALWFASAPIKGLRMLANLHTSTKIMFLMTNIILSVMTMPYAPGAIGFMGFGPWINNCHSVITGTLAAYNIAISAEILESIFDAAKKAVIIAATKGASFGKDEALSFIFKVAAVIGIIVGANLLRKLEITPEFIKTILNFIGTTISNTGSNLISKVKLVWGFICTHLCSSSAASCGMKFDPTIATLQESRQVLAAIKTHLANCARLGTC